MIKFIISLFLLFSLSYSNVIDIEKEKYYKRQVDNLLNKEYLIKNIVEELLLKTGGFGLFTGSESFPYSKNCINEKNFFGTSNYGDMCSIKLNKDYYDSLKQIDGLNYINGSLYPNRFYNINKKMLLDYFYNDKLNEQNSFIYKDSEIFKISLSKEIDVLDIKYLPKTNTLYIYNSLCKNECSTINPDILKLWKNDLKRSLEETSIETTGSVVKFHLNYLVIPTMEKMNECLIQNENAVPIFNLNIETITKQINGTPTLFTKISNQYKHKTFSPNSFSFSLCFSSLNGSVINLTGKPLTNNQHYSLTFKTYGKQLLSITRELTDEGLLPYTIDDSEVFVVDENGNNILDTNGNPIYAGSYVSHNPQINYETKSGIKTNINKYQNLTLSSVPILDTNGITIDIKERKPLFGSFDIDLEKNNNIINGLKQEVIQVPFLFTLFADKNPNLSQEDYEKYKETFFNSSFTIKPDTITSFGRCKNTKINGTDFFKPCNLNSDCNLNDVCEGAGQIGLIRKYVLEDDNGFKQVSPLYTSNMSVPCVNSPSFGYIGTNIGPMNNSLCELSKPISSNNYVCTYNSIHRNILEDLKSDKSFSFIIERFNETNFQENYNKRELLEDFIYNNSLNNGKEISSQQFGISNINKNYSLLENLDRILDTDNFFGYNENVNYIEPSYTSDIMSSSWPYTKVGELSFERNTYNDNGVEVKHVFLIKDEGNLNELGDTLAVFYNKSTQNFLYFDAGKSIRDYSDTGVEIIGELFFSKSFGDFYVKQVNKDFKRCNDTLAICNKDSDCNPNISCSNYNNKITLDFIRDYYGKVLNTEVEKKECRDNNGIISSPQINNEILPLKIGIDTILNNFHGLKDINN